MINATEELVRRSRESGVHINILKAVYLRELAAQRSGGAEVQQLALSRVDRFIIYATVRDSTCARDRDLVSFVTP